LAGARLRDLRGFAAGFGLVLDLRLSATKGGLRRPELLMLALPGLLDEIAPGIHGFRRHFALLGRVPLGLRAG
jgi:hypothetical protein